MKRWRWAILCMVCLSAGAGEIQLNWIPPTQNVDGTTLEDLAGYNIYWGVVSRDYAYVWNVPTPGTTQYVLQNLPEGQQFYIAMTAYNTVGEESAYSNEIVRTVPITPPGRGRLGATWDYST